MSFKSKRFTSCSKIPTWEHSTKSWIFKRFNKTWAYLKNKSDEKELSRVINDYTEGFRLIKRYKYEIENYKELLSKYSISS